MRKLLILIVVLSVGQAEAQILGNPGLLGPTCGPSSPSSSALCQPPPRCSTMNGTNPACSGLFAAIGWI
jgi:hypothetical protein